MLPHRHPGERQTATSSSQKLTRRGLPGGHPQPHAGRRRSRPVRSCNVRFHPARPRSAAPRMPRSGPTRRTVSSTSRPSAARTDALPPPRGVARPAGGDGSRTARRARARRRACNASCERGSAAPAPGRARERRGTARSSAHLRPPAVRSRHAAEPRGTAPSAPPPPPCRAPASAAPPPPARRDDVTGQRVARTYVTGGGAFPGRAPPLPGHGAAAPLSPVLCRPFARERRARSGGSAESPEPRERRPGARSPSSAPRCSRVAAKRRPHVALLGVTRPLQPSRDEASHRCRHLCWAALPPETNPPSSDPPRGARAPR